MSPPRVAVTPAQAIAHLTFLLGYEKAGELPVYTDGKPNPEHRLPCDEILRSGERLARIAAKLDLEDSAEVAIGLPRVHELVYSSTVLWAWVNGKEQVARASKFKPMPSVVLKIGSAGSERLMIWVLNKPVSDTQCFELNERISYALHAPRTRSKPDALRVPLPGTFMRVGRKLAAPVLLTRLHVECGLDYRKFAGLKEPPPKDAWKNRKAA